MAFKIIICICALLTICVYASADSIQAFDKNEAIVLLQEAECCADVTDVQALLDENEKQVFSKWESGPTPNLYVGAIAASTNEDGLLSCIGVFRQTATGPVLLDSSLAQFEGNTPAWRYSITLDFAPYRLNDREIAFGVRYHNSYQSTAHGEASDTLYLYRFWNGRLYPIFNVMTLDEGGNTDGTDEFSHHRIISMSTKKHNGFFDLIVKEKETENTSVLYWDGSAYAKHKSSR